MATPFIIKTRRIYKIKIVTRYVALSHSSQYLVSFEWKWWRSNVWMGINDSSGRPIRERSKQSPPLIRAAVDRSTEHYQCFRNGGGRIRWHSTPSLRGVVVLIYARSLRAHDLSDAPSILLSLKGLHLFPRHDHQQSSLLAACAGVAKQQHCGWEVDWKD